MMHERLHRLIRVETMLLTVLVLIALGAYGVSQSGILAAGDSAELVAHYRFDEGAGSIAYDYSNNSNNGVFNGVNWTEGRINDGAEFDGGTANITVDNVNLVGGSSELTVSAWVYAESLPNDYPAIAHQWGADTVWLLTLYPDDLSFWVHNGSSSTKLEMDTPFPTGRWVHVVGVFDGDANRKELYQDGELVASGGPSISSLNDISTDLVVGRRGTLDAWNGTIDDLRVYNVALNESDIKALYNHGSSMRTGTEPEETGGKVLDMSFDRWNSTQVFDTSGNNNHGTPQNGPEQRTIGYCKVGRCYEFDGSNDHVAVPDDDTLDNMSELTVMAWQKSTGASDWQNRIVSKWGSQEKDYQIFLGGNDYGSDGNADQAACEIRTEDGTILFDADTDMGTIRNDSKWHHVTCTYNGSHAHLYVDGVEQNMVKEGGGRVNDSAAELWIGESKGEFQSFEGPIDQVKVFDRALSQEEIITEAGIEREGAVLDLRFDEDAGSTAYDQSMHGNDGSLQPNESMGPQWTDGVSGGALEFDAVGVNDGVHVADSTSVSGMDRLTLSVWIQPRDTNPEQWFMRKHNEYTLRILNGVIGYDVNAADWSWNDAGITVNADEWYHVVLTYDGAEQRLYVDGTVVDTTAESGGISGMSNSVSVVPANQFSFNGTMDNARIYPYAISDAKVKELYRRGSSQVGGDTDTSKPAQAPNQSELVLHHMFDNVNSTHSLDSSGQVNHGTLENNPVQKSAVQCRVGRCIRFNAANDEYVRVSDDPSLDVTDSLTVATWVKVDISEQEYGWPRIFRKGETRPYRMLVNIDSGDQNLQFGVNSSETYQMVDAYTTTNITDGDWYHVTGTWNGTQMQMYVNGRLEGTTDFSDTIVINDEDLRIASGYEWSYLNGSLDDFRIYDRGLDKEEIWHLYSTGRDRLGSGEMAGPVGWWRFDNQTGQTAYDYSGEESDGTLGNDSVARSNDPSWVENCRRNGCLDFDGSSDYVNVTGHVTTANMVTLSAWVNTGASDSSHHDVVAIGDVVILRGMDSGYSGKANGVYYDGSSWHYTPAEKINDSKWHHVAFVLDGDGNEQTVYIDGEAAGTSTDTADPDFSAAFSPDTTIGRAAAGVSKHWDGKIDDVRIYPYALTDEQVKQVMNSGGTRVG